MFSVGDFPGGPVVKIPPPMQRTGVWTPVQEDFMCFGATKSSVPQVLSPCAPQQDKPSQCKARALQLERKLPLMETRESPPVAVKILPSLSSGCLNPEIQNSLVWGTNCIHCTILLHIRDFSICLFWYLAPAPGTNPPWIWREDCMPEWVMNHPTVLT